MRIESPLQRQEVERECEEQRFTISQSLNRTLSQADALDLDRTMQLHSEYEGNRQHSAYNESWGIRKTWKFEDEAGWMAACRRLARRLGNEEAAFFCGSYSSCGALQVLAKEPLSNPLPLLRFDRDSLKLQSLTSDGGLEVEWYEEGFGQEKYFVDIHGWGSWRSTVENGLLTPQERIRNSLREFLATLSRLLKPTAPDFYLRAYTEEGPWTGPRECRVVRRLKIRGNPQYCVIKLNPPVAGHLHRGRPIDLDYLVITAGDPADTFEEMRYPCNVWGYMLVTQKDPLVDTISETDLETVPAGTLHKKLPVEQAT
jgi:hypothetical protein